jgi:hypothetical protein
VIDVPGRREIARVAVGREPIAAAVAPDGRWLFVASHLPQDAADAADVAATVTAVATDSLQTTTIRLPNGSSSVRGLCLSPDGSFVFVVHGLARYQLPVTQPDRGWMNTSAMSVIDAATRKLVNTVLLDDVDRGAANPWGVAMTGDGRTIVVSHSGTHELSLIDAKGLFEKLIRAAESSKAVEAPDDLSFLVGLRERVALMGNGPRGLAIVGAKVYVAEHFTDTLGVVDLVAGGANRTSQIRLGPKPRLTPERRGEIVFHDATLSFQQWQSCASCHPDARADGLNWDLMNDGIGNPKNTRSMLLAHEAGPVMSMGVRASAEDAVRAGFLHSLFIVVPDGDCTAVDAYLKSLRPVPSPHLVDGRLSPAAERGRAVFFSAKAGCGVCHPEPIYSDKQLHNVGSRGRFDAPGDKFTSPRLIEAWRTAPYMHDGRYRPMKDLLVQGSHGLSRDEAKRPTDAEINDLVEFLLSL